MGDMAQPFAVDGPYPGRADRLPRRLEQWGQRDGVEMVKRQFAASDDFDTVGILTRGKLQTQLDARLASR